MDDASIKDVFAERLIDRGVAEETAKAIAAQCAPCVLLRLSYGWRPWRSKAGASRLGGWPDVPKNFVWPRSQYKEIWGARPNGEPYQLRQQGGSPLSFIAQLNLAELNPHLPDRTLLPAQGLLSIYFDRREMPVGTEPDDPTGWRVLHFDSTDALGPPEAPLPSLVPLRSCPVTPRSWLSLPADLGAIAGTEVLREEDWAAVLDESQKLELDAARYRMFGHPGTIKSTMEPVAQSIRRDISKEAKPRWSAAEAKEFEAASRKAWRLLVQFPSDRRAKVDWCETGTLFVWIHEEDLAARRFDKVWVTWQAA